MTIERTDTEIIIRLSSDVDIDGVQEMLDYLKYKVAMSKSQASQDDVDNLVREIKRERYKSFLKKQLVD
jgi:hypothetical protein